MFYKFNGIFSGQPENLVFLWEEKKKEEEKETCENSSLENSGKKVSEEGIAPQDIKTLPSNMIVTSHMWLFWNIN